MKNTKIISIIITAIMALFLVSVMALPAFAQTADVSETATTAAVETVEEAEEEDGGLSAKAIAAAITIAIVGAAGAIGMAIAIGKSADGMARQSEAAGKINSAMMLGLVFIETAIIYALIVAILIIFVL